MNKRKIVIAVTGASGSVYAKLLLKKLYELKFSKENCALIFSKNGQAVWDYELPDDKIEELPFTIYQPEDFFAPVASGSAGYDTMIICPCTMGTLGRIASGVSNDLITRAADVMLKERKKLILVTREMPLSLIHLKSMKTITEAGGIICPASPSFYSKPGGTEKILETVIDKILQLSGIETNSFQWGGK